MTLRKNNKLELLDSHIYLNPDALQSDLWRTGSVKEKLLMFTLLIFANHQPSDHNGLKVPRGDIHMTREKIQLISGFRSDIRRTLEKLEKRGLIETSVKYGKLYISIKNFERCIDPDQGFDYGLKEVEEDQREPSTIQVPSSVLKMDDQGSPVTAQYDPFFDDTSRSIPPSMAYQDDVIYEYEHDSSDPAQKDDTPNLPRGSILMGTCPATCHDYVRDSTYYQDPEDEFRADLESEYLITAPPLRTVKIYHTFIISPAWIHGTDKNKLVALTMVLCAKPEEVTDPYETLSSKPLSALLEMSYSDIAEASGKYITRDIVRHAVDAFKGKGFCRRENIDYGSRYRISIRKEYTFATDDPKKSDKEEVLCPELCVKDPLKKNGLPIYNILSSINEPLLKKGYSFNSISCNSDPNSKIVYTYNKELVTSDTITDSSDNEKEKNIYTSTGKNELERKPTGQKKKKKRSSKKKDRSHLYTPYDMELSKAFYKVIQKMHPELHLKVDKHKLEEGAIAYHRFHKVDGYDYKNVIYYLDWAIKDEFWRDKITSLPALRKRSKNGNTKFQNIIVAHKSQKTKEKKNKRRNTILEIMGE